MRSKFNAFMTCVATLCVLGLFSSNVYLLIHYLNKDKSFEDFAWVLASLVLFGYGSFLGIKQICDLWKEKKN